MQSGQMQPSSIKMKPKCPEFHKFDKTIELKTVEDMRTCTVNHPNLHNTPVAIFRIKSKTSGFISCDKFISGTRFYQAIAELANSLDDPDPTRFFPMMDPYVPGTPGNFGFIPLYDFNETDCVFNLQYCADIKAPETFGCKFFKNMEETKRYFNILETEPIECKKETGADTLEIAFCSVHKIIKGSLFSKSISSILLKKN